MASGGGTHIAVPVKLESVGLMLSFMDTRQMDILQDRNLWFPKMMWKAIAKQLTFLLHQWVSVSAQAGNNPPQLQYEYCTVVATAVATVQ